LAWFYQKQETKSNYQHSSSQHTDYVFWSMSFIRIGVQFNNKKISRYDIAEIVLKLALNTNQSINHLSEPLATRKDIESLYKLGHWFWTNIVNISLYIISFWYEKDNWINIVADIHVQKQWKKQCDKKKKKMSTINCLHYLSKNIGQNFKFSYIFINHCK
jgi:hypothetical protein